MYYIIGLIVFVIIFALIIWAFFSNSENSHKCHSKDKNMKSETHIHPKPHFNQKTNVITFRGSPHVKEYTVFKRVVVTEENKGDLWNITKSESSGVDTGLIQLASHDHDQSASLISLNLGTDHIEPSQIELFNQPDTNTGDVEVSKVATSTINGIRRFQVTFPPGLYANGTNLPRPLPDIVDLATNTNIGNFYVTINRGSTITLDNFTPLSGRSFNVINCGACCSNACSSKNIRSQYVGNLISFSENGSKLYCFSFPTEPCTLVPPFINISTVATFTISQSSGYTVNEPIVVNVTIDETSIADPPCGPDCDFSGL